MMPLLAMALLCVSGRYADEVSPEPVTIPASGFEWFSYLLGFPGWQGGPPAFLATVEEAEKDPSSTMIFCLGPVGILEDLDLKRFIRKGGALLIATEQTATPGVEYLLRSTLGCTPSGLEVRSARPQDPEHAYQNQSICPLAKAIGGKKHPWFFRDNQEVKPATNRPTILGKPSPGVQSGGFAGPVVPARSSILMANTDVESGRIGLIGDASIFTNLMLQAPDNIPFALNVAEWAREGKSQTRSKLLLIVDGNVVPQAFSPPLMLPPVPIPTPEALLDRLYRSAEGLVQGVEKGLADLDDRDALNESAQRAIPPNWFIYAAGIITLILSGLLIRLLAGSTSRSHFAKSDPTTPNPPSRRESFVTRIWRTSSTATSTAISRWKERRRPSIQP